MRLTDILRPECIRVPLEATSRQGAIYELIGLLADAHGVSDVDMLRDSVWRREMTRTTGIGHGLAIPHGKCPCCDRLMMAVGKPTVPIDFQSIDRKPVSVIFLLAGPPQLTGPHIQALAQVSRLMTSSAFRTAVEAAQTPQALFDLIVEAEGSKVM